MEYSRFVNAIKDLDFIGSTDRADAVIKAILGILASSMDEEHARKLTEKLPRPLDFERLRGHQARPVDITIEEFFSEIGAQFRINPEQARTVVDAVFRLCKDAIGEETVSEIEYDMPPDVAEELEAA